MNEGSRDGLDVRCIGCFDLLLAHPGFADCPLEGILLHRPTDRLSPGAENRCDVIPAFAAYGERSAPPSWLTNQPLCSCGSLERGRGASLDLAAPPVIIRIVPLRQLDQLQDNFVDMLEGYRIGSNEIQE